MFTSDPHRISDHTHIFVGEVNMSRGDRNMYVRAITTELTPESTNTAQSPIRTPPNTTSTISISNAATTIPESKKEVQETLILLLILITFVVRDL